VPRDVVRDAAFQDALLALLARACRLQADKGPSRGVRAEIEGRLDRLLRQSLRDGEHFETLDPARRHRVRKRLKRLRYLAEFTAPLHDAKKLAKYLRRLKDVQDALGDYNDDVTLLAALRGPEARGDRWFEIAWLEAALRGGARECGRELRKLARAHPFWR
jgi:CHAD domain-containing protein